MSFIGWDGVIHPRGIFIGGLDASRLFDREEMETEEDLPEQQTHTAAAAGRLVERKHTQTDRQTDRHTVHIVCTCKHVNR